MGKDVDNNKGKGFISNFLWRFAERCGAQGVSFVVSLVLARLVAPEAYGVIALITVFTKIMQVFIDSGLGNALIQKKNVDDLDYSSVFFFNMGTCFFLYALMFLTAPWIASFYNNADLTSMIRVLSLTLIISGLKNVQQSYVSKNMLFKKFFFATLGGTCVAAVIGIMMAYLGYGVWALIAQILINNAIDTIILWFSVSWHPKWMFSFKRIKHLMSYGWKLLVTSLSNTLYVDIRELIIGKLYSSASLAYYNKGMQLPNLVMDNINTSINSVLFPVLSAVQDEMDWLKTLTRKSIRVGLYIISPMMVGISCCASEIISILYTEKWSGSVPFLQIFCIYYIFRPIEMASLNAIKAVGRSDIILKQEIIKKLLGITVLFAVMRYGPLAMAISLLCSELVNTIINLWPTRKLLNYTYAEMLGDFIKNTSGAFVMGLLVIVANHLHFSTCLSLVIKITIGIIAYLLWSIVTRNESFKYVYEIVGIPILKRLKSFLKFNKQK